MNLLINEIRGNRTLGTSVRFNILTISQKAEKLSIISAVQLDDIIFNICSEIRGSTTRHLMNWDYSNGICLQYTNLQDFEALGLSEMNIKKTNTDSIMRQHSKTFGQMFFKNSMGSPVAGSRMIKDRHLLCLRNNVMV